jgi:hypothetical protein
VRAFLVWICVVVAFDGMTCAAIHAALEPASAIADQTSARGTAEPVRRPAGCTTTNVETLSIQGRQEEMDTLCKTLAQGVSPPRGSDAMCQASTGVDPKHLSELCNLFAQACPYPTYAKYCLSRVDYELTPVQYAPPHYKN